MGTVVGLVDTDSLETHHRRQEELMRYYEYLRPIEGPWSVYTPCINTKTLLFVRRLNQKALNPSPFELAQEMVLAEEATQSRLWAAEDAAENSQPFFTDYRAV